MGRFIRLDQPIDTLNDWVIPNQYARYDQRYKPWPNQLFPYDLQISDHPIQGLPKIAIRRCIEQECRGDVAIEHVYSPTTLTWFLWFQYENDRDLVSNYVVKFLEHLQQGEQS